MLKKLLAVPAVLAVSVPARAADLTALTAEIDFAGVTTAVLAVAVALAGVYITWKAASMVLRAIRGM